MFVIYGDSYDEQEAFSIKLRGFALFIICYRINFLSGRLIKYSMLKLAS